MPISIEDFKKLPSEKPARAAVSNEELIAALSENAMTTAEVAAFLGVKANDERWWAWCAAVIDCDGSIYFSKHGRDGYTWFTPCIAFSNNSAELVSAFRSLTGATFEFGHGKQKRTKVIGLERCEYVLRRILPYLFAKRRQALLVLEFIAYRKEARHKAVGERGYSLRELEIVQKVSQLNHKCRIPPACRSPRKQEAPTGVSKHFSTKAS